MEHWSEIFARGEFREVQPNARTAASIALERCGALADELARRCRVWCTQEGVAPHASLEVAAGLALAIAAEGVRRPEVLRHELLLRAARLDTPEGLLGLEPAAFQLLAYLESGPLTGRFELEGD